LGFLYNQKLFFKMSLSLPVTALGIDPHAFVVINDTLEVIGRRHGVWQVR